jgi:hypothetical protein
MVSFRYIETTRPRHHPPDRRRTNRFHIGGKSWYRRSREPLVARCWGPGVPTARAPAPHSSKCDWSIDFVGDEQPPCYIGEVAERGILLAVANVAAAAAASEQNSTIPRRMQSVIYTASQPVTPPLTGTPRKRRLCANAIPDNNENRIQPPNPYPGDARRFKGENAGCDRTSRSATSPHRLLLWKVRGGSKPSDHGYSTIPPSH